MKLRNTLAILAVSLAFGLTANANIIEISLDPSTHTPSDVPFNDIGGNPVSVFGWLEGEILSWNNFVNNPHLPDPTTGHVRHDNLGGVGPTIQVEAGDYLVMHYGVGPNGDPGTGGGLVAYYVTAGQSLTVANDGPGPNGTGGISFVDIWDHTGVPDGGMTLTLLGGALTGLGLIRRRLSC
jgi:hypothetical protein